MSVQIALEAPATRVASRKLGPVAGSRSPPGGRAPPRPGRRARWRARAGGARRSRGSRRGVSASIAAGRAPSPRSSRCRRSYRIPPVARGRGQVPGRAVEQVRRARARCPRSRRPPAGGRRRTADRRWRRRRRAWSSRRRSRRSPRRRAPSASATIAGERLDRDRDEHHLGARRPPRRRWRAARSTAPRSSAARSAALARVVAGHRRPEALARGERDRAADQPDADDSDLHLRPLARARTVAARPSSTSTVVSQSRHPSVIDWP